MKSNNTKTFCQFCFKVILKYKYVDLLFLNKCCVDCFKKGKEKYPEAPGKTIIDKLKLDRSE